MKFYGWLRAQWHNGGRLLIVSISVCSLLIVFMGVLTLRTLNEEFTPIETKSELIPDRVIIKPVSLMKLSRPYCNNTSEDLVGSTGSVWKSNTDELLEQIPAVNGVTVFEPGCHIIEYKVLVPAGLSDGSWRITGQTLVLSGSRFQSFPFRVSELEVQAVEGE